MQADDSNKKMARLGWACRRGMLELDVLLGNYLKEAYSHASIEDQQRFEKLLEENDQQLYNWLLGSHVPTDVNIKRMVTLIQTHARNRIQS